MSRNNSVITFTVNLLMAASTCICLLLYYVRWWSSVSLQYMIAVRTKVSALIPAMLQLFVNCCGYLIGLIYHSLKLMYGIYCQLGQSGS